MKTNPQAASGGRLREEILKAWRTNGSITRFFIDNLPERLWEQKVPGYPRKTVRMIAGHIHNCRCMWVKMTGRRLGVQSPEGVNRHRVNREELLAALARSEVAVCRVLEASLDRGGDVPGFPNGGVVHFLTYLTAHEAHHRGQICMLARQLGDPLPGEVTNGIWLWSRRAKESGLG